MYSLPFEEEINSYQRHENISTLNLIKFILPVAKFFTAQSFSSNWCYFYLFCYTVKPLLSGHPLLSGQKPKSPNLFPLFTLNETFIKRTRTPKKYLKWSFLLLPTCIKRTLVIKFHHPTCQTPEMRKIASNCHPQIFRFLHWKTWLDELMWLVFTVQDCFLFRFVCI